MLYSKSKTPELSMELFQNPTSEYRATPFWAWNCKLDKDTLLKQIEMLKEMGFGGGHMHVRTGMSTEYLSKEFFELIRSCCDKFEKEDMIGWLYDEDRWPSGSAGGLVTKNKKYRQRYLNMSPNPMSYVSEEEGINNGRPYFVACYDIQLNTNGELERYNIIPEDGEACGTKWYAYVCTAAESPWYNNQSYIDTLNPDAVDEFIRLTYEGYKKAVGDKFGKSVFTIFTDEPNFFTKESLPFAASRQAVRLPWTIGFDRLFEDTYQESIREKLPELFWELPEGRISTVRYHYHDFLAERFASSYAGHCGKWCEENGLMLTGHVLEEPRLGTQTSCTSEAMRSYRSFQIPGIDMLCNYQELTTAKQAQSVSHQQGREGVLSELYGVTNWDFDFRGYKYQGDWQAALGVTVRVPHLSWVSMEGEAKRDYPASIFYQSPWYKKFPLIEDHFARVNTALTRGKPVVRVGVIHPIESYWLHWGPLENTEVIRNGMEQKFRQLADNLLFGNIDYDYIAESLLPEFYGKSDSGFKVGEMNYDTVIVPGLETIRSSTLKCLENFKSNGGKIIFMGERPKFVDAKPKTVELYDQCIHIGFNNEELLSVLEENRDIEIKSSSGKPANCFIYNMRQDNGCKWLFIANAKQPQCTDLGNPGIYRIKIKGCYSVTLFDTMNGTCKPESAVVENGYTIIDKVIYENDSLLYKLTKHLSETYTEPAPKTELKEVKIPKTVDFTLSENNVLLLDVAEYSLDNEDFHSEEEILRLDNECRKKLNMPLRNTNIAQPWVTPEKPYEHCLTLRFTIDSELELHNAFLALENAEKAEIHLNGEKVENKTNGYYVDMSIKKVQLPAIKKGSNILEITSPFGELTGAEWCYLLGDFNVRVNGRQKTIVTPADKIGFSDITVQGLPFYGGNISYSFEIETSFPSLKVNVSNYRGALVSVKLDDEEKPVIFAPYDAIFENVKPGMHKLSFTLYGNRVNSFGAVHKVNQGHKWVGPNYWRSTGNDWCYEYKLKNIGILSSPKITEIKTVD